MIDQMIEPLQPLKPQGDRGCNHSLIHYVLYITFIQGRFCSGLDWS